ncbi:hypothetical protein BDA96_01G366200, partial [Sorghum bicolor]
QQGASARARHERAAAEHWPRRLAVGAAARARRWLCQGRHQFPAQGGSVWNHGDTGGHRWVHGHSGVGDSRCILDTQGGELQLLTVDHSLEENAEERERVTASGGEVGRLKVGPLWCWPGGLCLSRSIGDMDVGEFIVPIPHVKQEKLSNTGGRLIIASDGIWYALSNEAAAQACRGLPAELAAKLVVKQALKTSRLKDDTTCVVVDIIPSDHLTTPQLSPKKNQNKLKSLFHRRSHTSVGKLGGKSASIGCVEELFEESSAMLEERYACCSNAPLHSSLC